MVTRTDTINLTNKLNEASPLIKSYLNMVIKDNIELKLTGVTPEFATKLLEDVYVDEILGDGELTYVAYGYIKDTKVRIYGEGWDGIAYFTRADEED